MPVGNAVSTSLVDGIRRQVQREQDETVQPRSHCRPTLTVMEPSPVAVSVASTMVGAVSHGGDRHVQVVVRKIQRDGRPSTVIVADARRRSMDVSAVLQRCVHLAVTAGSLVVGPVVGSLLQRQSAGDPLLVFAAVHGALDNVVAQHGGSAPGPRELVPEHQSTPLTLPTPVNPLVLPTLYQFGGQVHRGRSALTASVSLGILGLALFRQDPFKIIRCVARNTGRSVAIVSRPYTWNCHRVSLRPPGS